MTVEDWLAHSTADAERRGLSQLVPLLQTLARSTEALRAADAEFDHPTSADADKPAAEYTEQTEDGDQTNRAQDGRD